MKSRILSFLFFIISFSYFAQDSIPELEDKSIKGQFEKVYKTSTTFKPKGTTKRYKVINIKNYDDLKYNILDSIKNHKKSVFEKEELLNKERENLRKTKITLEKTQADLEASKKKENSISLFGIELSKFNYNLLLWSIIIISLLGLFYFIFKFLRSNVLTKEAQKNLLDVEQEFEEHRKKSLAREQKLRRQLQDEVNKSRNN